MAVFRSRDTSRFVAVLTAMMLISGNLQTGFAQQAAPPADGAQQDAPHLTAEQLDSLVAPIALYPDQLLGQVLAASTYPLEIMEAQQWLQKNTSLKGTALTEAAAKQDWDASIQAMVAFPDVLKRLSENVKWTTDLGNAFLAQQSDLMAAVQRQRKKAMDKGALKTTEQQKVETKTVEQQQVIVVEPANPQVIYVPQYNPTVVYGPPPAPYPYPPVYYPPPPPGPSTGEIIATAAISFTAGIALGAFFSGCCGYGGWGWGCGWGHNNTVIINNNFYNRYNFNRVNINTGNINVGNRVGNTNVWQHNPAHRAGVPYNSQRLATQYHGQALGQPRVAPNRGLGSTGGVQNQRLSGAQGARPSGNLGASQPGARGGGSVQAQHPQGADRVGSREIPRSSGSNGLNVQSRDQAHASSNRGFSSLGSSRTSGFSKPSGGARGGVRRR